jgi:hypothetical protein
MADRKLDKAIPAIILPRAHAADVATLTGRTKRILIHAESLLSVIS